MSMVTLVSGGLDSTLMSVLAKEEGIPLAPLFFDYGQLSADQEWAACQSVHERHGLPSVVRMGISGFGSIVPSGLTRRSMRINEDAFLPGRNLLFLVCGAAYAYSVQASSVAIGLLNPDDALFPDQTSRFLEVAQDTIECSIGRRIRVVAPLIEFTKAEVQSMADLRRIQGTYSCHSGDKVPCGRCVSCIESLNARRRAQ